MVAVIIGGTRGIGASCAKLISRRMPVVILGRSAPNEISNCDINTFALQCHVNEFESVQQSASLVDKWLKSRQESLSVVIGAAGISKSQRILTQPVVDMRKIIDTNLMGALYMSKVYSKLLMRSKHDYKHMIFIGSIVGQMGNIGQCAYAASKAGLEGLTKSLALELAPKQILVNAVAPGFIDTDMARVELTQTQLETLSSKLPLKRLGTSDEVAELVDFLTQTRYITGTTVTIDGGISLSNVLN